MYRILFLMLLFCCGASLTTNAQQDSITHAEAEPEVAVVDTLPTPVEIADITIKGNKKTKPYIIQREIPFKEGDRMMSNTFKEKLLLAKQQVMNTSLFVTVSVNVVKQEGEKVFVEVLVKERWYLFPLPYFKMVDRNFNEWWVSHKRSLERVNYGFKFMQNNVSGRNDNLNLWLVTGYTQQAAIRYESPFLDNTLKHGMNVGFSYSRNRELNYMTSSNRPRFFPEADMKPYFQDYVIKHYHADIGYSYRPAIKTRHNFRVGYSDIQVHDSIVEHNPNYFPNNANRLRFPDFSYSILYFNVDYIPYPLKGFSGDAYFYTRFGDHNMTAVGGKATYSFPVAPKSYIMLQAAGAIRLPFKQPYYSTRLFGTSDLYLRGLEYYVIEGVAGGMLRATAKREALSFTFKNPLGTKTHDEIPFRFFLKAYGDVGYAYHRSPGNSTLNNTLLRTWGIGLDVVTIYDLVLKIEYSFNQLGESGFFFHTKSDF